MGKNCLPFEKWLKNCPQCPSPLKFSVFFFLLLFFFFFFFFLEWWEEEGVAGVKVGKAGGGGAEGNSDLPEICFMTI